MSAELAAKLLVMDTGPLITLAVGDVLDYLLYAGVPVIIADAVLYEATRDANALGAQAVLEWVQANSENVRTISTEVFFNHVAGRLEEPGRRERDLGERAALEALHDAVVLGAGERALLLTEDDRVLRQVLVVDAELTERIIPITTRDYLDGLEQAGRIQSAEEIYKRAEDAGRLASRRRVIKDQHEAAVEAVRKVLGIGSRSEGT